MRRSRPLRPTAKSALKCRSTARAGPRIRSVASSTRTESSSRSRRSKLSWPTARKLARTALSTIRRRRRSMPSIDNIPANAAMSSIIAARRSSRLRRSSPRAAGSLSSAPTTMASHSAIGSQSKRVGLRWRLPPSEPPSHFPTAPPPSRCRSIVSRHPMSGGMSASRSPRFPRTGCLVCRCLWKYPDVDVPP